MLFLTVYAEGGSDASNKAPKKQGSIKPKSRAKARVDTGGRKKKQKKTSSPKGRVQTGKRTEQTTLNI